MPKTEAFDAHTDQYEAWFEKYEPVFQSELRAIQRQFEALPEELHGIEVGLGSGRFSQALGIKEGVEPSESMRELAVERGIEVMDAAAEHLPYGDLQFDFVLFVTLCYLDDVKMALKEAYRVLKLGGSVIIGFIDSKGKLAKQYEEKRYRSNFYRNVRFCSVDYIESTLKEIGFRDPVYFQTIFKPLDDIKEPEEPKEGIGEGSFVVVRATRK